MSWTLILLLGVAAAIGLCPAVDASDVVLPRLHAVPHRAEPDNETAVAGS